MSNYNPVRRSQRRARRALEKLRSEYHNARPRMDGGVVRVPTTADGQSAVVGPRGRLLPLCDYINAIQDLREAAAGRVRLVKTKGI